MTIESQDRSLSKWCSLDCPFCHALFKVDQKDLLPLGHYSFSCLSCKHIFWAGLNKDQQVDVWTFKPSPKKNSEKLVNEEKICPHCLSMMKTGVVECHQCGKAFYDTQWMQNCPYSSFRLRKLFENLLCFYDSAQKHGEFVSACIKENNIAFGLYCYKRLMKTRKNDDQARKMFQYLQSTAQTSFPSRSKKMDSRDYLTGWFHAMMLCAVLILISLLFV